MSGILNALIGSSGGGAQLFVEDVFSTYLYTGNGAAGNGVANNINLSGEGGMVWIKLRSGAGDNFLFDTVRGRTNRIVSNSTAAQVSDPGFNYMQVFYSFGFDFGSAINVNAATYASWTFRKAPKFFDVVTYTGNGVNGRLIPSSLATGPGTLGAIIVKRLDSASDWKVFHRRNGSPSINNLILNSGNAQQSSNNDTGFVYWENNGFLCYTGSTDISAVNESGGSYVAYLYSHDATSDGVIQCGSYTGNGSNTGPIVTLGWEPQWVMIKNTSANGTDWIMLDNMRGIPVGSEDAKLTANTSDAESSAGDFLSPTATGFQLTTTSSAVNTNGSTYIYIAIRRGPMRTPTLGTSVFAPVAQNATTNGVVTSNFPVDLSISAQRDRASFPFTLFIDRLRGSTLASSAALLASNSTNAESNFGTSSGIGFDRNTAIVDNLWAGTYGASSSISYLNFRRAPGFMDEVCYAGTGSVEYRYHNLGVTPELIIVKARTASAATNWNAGTEFGVTDYRALKLNTTDGNSPKSSYSSAGIFYEAPDASKFTVYGGGEVNSSGRTYVAYLFASCPGVSKVGSYTGTGALQTVNCAFTTGARFVLIKRTDTTGDWYVWNSATGISSGNDPYLLLNTTAAEVTGTNYVDTDTTGFKVTAAAPAGINANGGTYIFLAIA